MVVSALVRRGMEFAAQDPQDPQQPNIHLSGWLTGLFVFTAIAFVFCIFKVNYTYGMIVGTLAAVEETNPEVYVRIEANPDPTKPTGPNDPADFAVEAAPQPITRKLRTTVKHLRARAGFWSRFRGFSIYVVWMFTGGIVATFTPFAASNFFGQIISQIIVAVLTANLRLAWVHIVISEPSPKRFYQRLPGLKTWAKIVPVAAVCQAANAIALYVPLMLEVGVHGWKWLDGGADSQPDQAELQKVSAAMILPGCLTFLVSIITNAIFVRVAASLLPDEHEAIVPFDRHFGGKVVPELLGGSGMLSLRDAWATFDGAARVRYFKTMGKVFAMQMGVMILFIVLVVCEVYAGALSLGNSRD